MLTESSYNRLTKEELIRLLEIRDNKEETMSSSFGTTNATNIRRIISEVLVLLFNEEYDPIEKSMKLLLDFFDADWGYVAIFEKDGLMVNFPCEVMNESIEVPKDNLSKLSYETMPWIIETVKSGRDIVLRNMDDLPEEAQNDRLLLQEQHLKSMLIIPLSFHHKIQGFIGFDSVRVSRNWTTTEVEDMHLIAHIFSIIIERWQTENNMEESRKHLSEQGTKFQLFFNNLPIGVELYDAAGYMIDNNDADSQIFGSKREDMIGINLFENPAVPTKMLDRIKKGKAFSFRLVYDFSMIQKNRYYASSINNSTKYLQVRGISLTNAEFGRIGYLLIISDNTEKQLKDEQTKNSLAILKAVLVSGRSIIGEYNIEKDKLYIDPILNDHQDYNKLFEFLKINNNLSLKELNKFSQPDNNNSNDFTPLLKVIQGELNNCSMTVRARFEDETIWIRINAQAHKINNTGHPSKVVCYITDITEEKELEEKLQEAKVTSRQSELEMQKAREADKLKSTFLANMSHEIRTPLNAIVGFSSIIAEMDNTEDRSEYVQIINKNSDLLLRLITDILDFSKIESGVMDYVLADINMKDICSEQYKVHSLKVQEGVCIFCDLDSLPDVILYTDARRITQVISNLLSNALKFTEQGSITLSYKKESNRVLFEITDTGIGIPLDRQSAIFDRFTKMDSFKQGTGLGLTICKTIVEALHGTIGVDSTPGKGSRFWFTLPY